MGRGVGQHLLPPYNGFYGVSRLPCPPPPHTSGEGTGCCGKASPRSPSVSLRKIVAPLPLTGDAATSTFPCSLGAP